MTLRVLIAGGGTGGHIYPGLTIARALKAQGVEVAFVGTQRGLEADLVPREGFPLFTIAARGLPRRLSPALVRAGFVALKGAAEAWLVVRRYRPNVVVGTGGYVAGPAVLAAALQRIPTIIQEQNVLPGVTNRMLERFVTHVALGYSEAAEHFRQPRKLVVTGNPIRKEILTTTRQQGARALALDPARLVLLVIGASQGARSINQAVLGAYDRLQIPNLQVLFVTGKRDFEAIAAELAQRGAQRTNDRVRLGNYHVVPYLYDMPSAYAVADLVVNRAGAMSLAELTARGLPAVLVPLPHAAENHQEHNARALERAGAAVVLLDRDLTAERLVDTVVPLLQEPKRRQAMANASARLGRPDAVDQIVALVLASARR